MVLQIWFVQSTMSLRIYNVNTIRLQSLLVALPRDNAKSEAKTQVAVRTERETEEQQQSRLTRYQITTYVCNSLLTLSA